MGKQKRKVIKVISETSLSEIRNCLTREIK